MRWHTDLQRQGILHTVHIHKNLNYSILMIVTFIHKFYVVRTFDHDILYIIVHIYNHALQHIILSMYYHCCNRHDHCSKDDGTSNSQPGHIILY